MVRSITLALTLSLFAGTAVQAGPIGSLQLRPIAQVEAGGDAEIVSYDPDSRRLFVVNGSSGSIEIFSLAEPWNPTRISTLDLGAFGGGANSVATRDGIVAVAVEADDKQAAGSVLFFDTDGQLLSQVIVGALPDMLVFTPDGRTVVVANEGEPRDYCASGLAEDPEGSISLIDISGGVAGLTQADVRTAGFGAFDGAAPDGVRIFGPNATVAQDLEPEYVTVSPDSGTAWVVLQENNALAVVDLATATVTDLVALGTKDHSRPENALDASNEDGAIRIVPWPVHGFYQPDAIASYQVGGATYLITANEGDARDYDCYSEEARVKDLELDPSVFPQAESLQRDEQLGRLKTTTANGDTDGDGDFDRIYSYGGRSFSIWSASGELLYDSGKDLELITASRGPAYFNSQGAGDGSFDNRSDDKGPEPEGLAVGAFRGRTYAFVGLERVGGVAVFDVTDPLRPFYVDYVDNLTPGLTPAVGNTFDQGPEGLLYIPREQAPRNRALLVVASENSGTLTVYSVRPKAAP